MSDLSPVERQMRFWLVTLVVLLIGLYFLRGILLPFVAGLALAYLLDPVANRLQKLGMGRLTASVVILLLFVLAFILVLLLLMPIVVNQLGAVIQNLPATAQRIQWLAKDYGGPIIERLGGPEALTNLERSLSDFVGQAASWLGTFIFPLVWWAGSDWHFRAARRDPGRGFLHAGRLGANGYGCR